MSNNKEDARIFSQFHDIIQEYTKDSEIRTIIRDNRDRRPKDTQGWQIGNFINWGGT